MILDILVKEKMLLSFFAYLLLVQI